MTMFDDLRRQYVNLAQPRLGAEVVHATDDFFADKARLIDAAEPVFIPGKYDENGKWMDGWESRRKRIPGHDWCVVRLGVQGLVAGSRSTRGTSPATIRRAPRSRSAAAASAFPARSFTRGSVPPPRTVAV